MRVRRLARDRRRRRPTVGSDEFERGFAHGGRRPPPLRAVVLAPVATALMFAGMMLSAVAGGGVLTGTPAPWRRAEAGPSALAVTEIPPCICTLYEQAARRYGLDWADPRGDREG